MRKLTFGFYALVILLIAFGSGSRSLATEFSSNRLILLTVEMGVPELTKLIAGLTQHFKNHMRVPITNLEVSNTRLHMNLSGELPGCSFGIARAPRFETKYHWIRQTAQTQVSLFKVIHRKEDIKTLSYQPTMVLRASAAESVARRAQMTYLAVNSRRQIVEMLAYGRSDTWLAFDIAAHVFDSATDRFELARIRDLVNTPIWLACASQVDPGLQKQLATIWDTGLASGTIPKIFDTQGLTDFLPDPEASIKAQWEN